MCSNNPGRNSSTYMSLYSIYIFFVPALGRILLNGLFYIHCNPDPTCIEMSSFLYMYRIVGVIN